MATAYASLGDVEKFLKKNKAKKALNRAIFSIVFGLTIGIVSFFIHGFVLETMYNWFIPAITGLNKITFWYACGLNAVIQYVIGMNKSLHSPGHEKAAKAIEEGGAEYSKLVRMCFTRGIIYPFVALFFAWWIHCYC